MLCETWSKSGLEPRSQLPRPNHLSTLAIGRLRRRGRKKFSARGRKGHVASVRRACVKDAGGYRLDTSPYVTAHPPCATWIHAGILCLRCDAMLEQPTCFVAAREEQANRLGSVRCGALFRWAFQFGFIDFGFRRTLLRRTDCVPWSGVP